ncbi:hypothetical protein [Microbulbifer sp. TRSA007]|uniref:hypothetical protein n=1 Tax=Microbulbifer sp. TRSA007 TaxID=3243384 RepID=UPI00403A0494
MKKGIKNTGIQLLILLGLFVASIVWWRLWFYQGFVGPIPFLHWFISVDGEASYDLTYCEILIQLILIWLLSKVFYYIKKRYGKSI